MFEYNGFKVSNSCVQMKVATFGSAGAVVGGIGVSVGGTDVSVGFTSVGLSVGLTTVVSVALGAAGAEVDVGVALALHAPNSSAATVNKINNLYNLWFTFSSFSKKQGRVTAFG